jgi:glycosyltransferase involved in cell wall biosynthesis
MSARIALVPYALDRPLRGIGRYTLELLEALEREGLEMTLLQAGAMNGHHNSMKLPGVSLLPALLTIGQIEIAWITWRHKLNLVHDPTGVIPIRMSPAKRIATIHDVIPYIYPTTCTKLDWLIYRFWLPFAVDGIDRVIADSKKTKADIVQFLPIEAEKVTVIPGAANKHYRRMNAEEIQPALERAKIDFPYILYVGSIEPRKNLPRLMVAYALLRQWSTNWQLVIVGARNFWKSTPVAAVVDRLGLENCVHFTGYIAEQDLPAIYNGADLFVFPSLYEGFGLPVLEAMACGTPVVTSNKSSLPEVAGDAAILIDPYDVDALANAMHRILSDPDLAEEMAAKGMIRAREFSWERTARETIAVYEQVLGEEFL